MEITAAERGVLDKATPHEFVIQPRFALEQAREIQTRLVESRGKGGFLGVGKVTEQLEAVCPLFYPYYEIEIELAVSEEQKTGLLSRRTVEKIVSATVPVDAVLGDIVIPGAGGISYPYGFLSSLSGDEISILRAIRADWFDVSRVMAIGFNESRATKLVKGIVGKGVVERRDTRPMAYRVRVLFPDRPQFITPISQLAPTQGRTNGLVIAPSMETSSVIAALESYWAKTNVKGISTVHYPYYVSVLKTQDGSERVEVLDGITGTLNESLGTRVRWDLEEIRKASH